MQADSKCMLLLLNTLLHDCTHRCTIVCISPCKWSVMEISTIAVSPSQDFLRIFVKKKQKYNDCNCCSCSRLALFNIISSALFEYSHKSLITCLLVGAIIGSKVQQTQTALRFIQWSFLFTFSQISTHLYIAFCLTSAKYACQWVFLINAINRAAIFVISESHLKMYLLF